jgi:hypothetical protein
VVDSIQCTLTGASVCGSNQCTNQCRCAVQSGHQRLRCGTNRTQSVSAAPITANNQCQCMRTNQRTQSVSVQAPIQCNNNASVCADQSVHQSRQCVCGPTSTIASVCAESNWRVCGPISVQSRQCVWTNQCNTKSVSVRTNQYTISVSVLRTNWQQSVSRVRTNQCTISVSMRTNPAYTISVSAVRLNQCTTIISVSLCAWTNQRGQSVSIVDQSGTIRRQRDPTCQ